MPFIITTNALITCTHGGTVTLAARQTKVTIQNGAVLCEQDLDGAAIVGCPQASPGTKPCTLVVSTAPESVSRKVMVEGRGVHLSTLDGVTDGQPPVGLIVSDPGQTVVQA